MTEWRLEAYQAVAARWTEPEWANVHYAKPDFQDDLLLFCTEQKHQNTTALDEVDPELARHLQETWDFAIDEQKKLTGVAVDVS